MVNIKTISCLSDNYSYIIHDSISNLVGVVDPSEFKTLDSYISKKYKKLDYIFNTHNHLDHVGGNRELKEKYSSKIIGSKKEKNVAPGADILLCEKDYFKFGSVNFDIIDVPGHTSGHIAFYLKNEGIIFTGDVLFSLGCGRIFEGDYVQMFNSLNKIKKLPKKTKIFCGHEYTKKNLDFCEKYEKSNKRLNKKKEWINSQLKKGMPTIPTLLEDELDTNIFLRCDNLSIKKGLEMIGSTDELVFRKLRNLKDEF
jgi:hydroxyacylglutathione hydrolase